MDMSRETGELADYQLVGEFANNMLVTLPTPHHNKLYGVTKGRGARTQTSALLVDQSASASYNKKARESENGLLHCRHLQFGSVIN